MASSRWAPVTRMQVPASSGFRRTLIGDWKSDDGDGFDELLHRPGVDGTQAIRPE